jgi:glycosyltransferase involved in cell wall biosynthesis
MSRAGMLPPKDLLLTRLRGRLREAGAFLERRGWTPQVDDWSRPLVGGSPGQAPGPVDLLAQTLTSDRAIKTAERSSSVGRTVDEFRCLLVTSRLDVGGLDEMVAFLALHLPAYGLRTAVLHATPRRASSTQSAGRIAGMLRAQGIEVYEATEETASAWIGQWAPDVISAHGAPLWIFAAAERAGVPFVDNLHGMFSVFGADWRWHSEVGDRTSLAAVVVVSDLIRRDYLACNPGFPAERLPLIPNGVDSERLSGGDREAARDRLGLADEYVFVSLARHSLQKNSYGLLAAFAEVARRCPEAHLVIAGRPDDPRYFRKVLQLRESLPCRDRIHLRDHTVAPAALLAAADGFVLDSFFEGWSLASMEALFVGVPVVLSDVGGAREQVADDPARGYVVANPLGDPLAVNWGSVGAARFQPQVNRDEFVARMADLIAERGHYRCARRELAAESALRFRAEGCLERHAAVLAAAAQGKEMPDLVLPHRSLGRLTLDA